MPQPAPKLEKIKVDKLPSPRPPKLPAECPVVSPERLTAAVGEGAYIPRSPPWPPDSPRRSRNKDSNANVRYAKAERLSRFEEEKERGKKKKKKQLLLAKERRRILNQMPNLCLELPKRKLDRSRGMRGVAGPPAQGSERRRGGPNRGSPSRFVPAIRLCGSKEVYERL